MASRPASLLRHRCLNVVRPCAPAVVALAARDLDSGATVAVEAGRRFHAASTMKVAILIEVYRQANAGQLTMDDEIPVHNRFSSIATTGAFAVHDDTDDALHEAVGEAVSIRVLAERMIAVSSNLAANLLLEHVGAEAVQSTIMRLGAGGMTVRRLVEDLAAYEAGVVNTTTPAALVALFRRLAEGRAVGPEVDADMVALLRRQQFREGLPAGLPDGATAAHKSGWTSSVHHDAGLVETPDRDPYVLAICTQGFPDANTATTLIARLTALIHDAWRGTPD